MSIQLQDLDPAVVGAHVITLVGLALQQGDTTVKHRAMALVRQRKTMSLEERFVLDVFNCSTAELNAEYFS
jgi:hypothetical protein